MNVKQRYAYIDYGKAIGILLIIFAHVSQYFPATQAACYYVCSFHVPVFFMLGGCLSCYKNNSKENHVARRIKSLLIPYVIFLIINSGLKFAVLLLQNGITSQALKSELIQLFITGNGTVWFCVTYLLVEIAFYFSKKLKHYEFVMPIIAVVSVIIAFAFNWSINPVGMVIVRVFAGFAFYVIGYYMVYCLHIDKLNALLCLVICFISFAIQAFIYFNFGNAFAFFEGIFKRPVVSLSNAILGGCGVIMLSLTLAKLNLPRFFKRFLDYIGQNSLIIMLVHPTLLLLFTYPLRDIMLNSKGIVSLTFSIVLFVLIVFLEIPAIYIVKRWFPWMIGEKFRKKIKEVENG